MLLLSSLLGPAKPPVASQEDVNAANGTFVVREQDGQLVAYEVEGSRSLPLTQEDRCLICLDGYQASEEMRQLGKCSHFFHKGCVDEVCIHQPDELKRCPDRRLTT